MSKQQQQTKPSPKLDNEFAWAIRPLFRRCVILLSCWTTPFIEAKIQTFTQDDGISARALALFLIAALTFAVRGETGGSNNKELFTAFAGGIAAILSAVLNFLARRFDIAVGEKMIISAYASTIVVMVLFVIFQQFLFLSTLEELVHLVDPSDVVVPAIIAGIVTFGLLLIKSAFLDKNNIGSAAVRHGIMLTAGSTIIVIVIGLMSSWVFEQFVKWFSHVQASTA
jgi:hypothetical protein